MVALDPSAFSGLERFASIWTVSGRSHRRRRAAFAQIADLGRGSGRCRRRLPVPLGGGRLPGRAPFSSLRSFTRDSGAGRKPLYIAGYGGEAYPPLVPKAERPCAHRFGGPGPAQKLVPGS